MIEMTDKSEKKGNGAGRNEAFLAQAGKGRPKGVPNKATIIAKSVIAEAAEGLGGMKRVIEWAQESPENEKVFWSSMFVKLIPVQTEVTGANGGPIQHRDLSNAPLSVLEWLAAQDASDDTAQTVQ